MVVVVNLTEKRAEYFQADLPTPAPPQPSSKFSHHFAVCFWGRFVGVVNTPQHTLLVLFVVHAASRSLESYSRPAIAHLSRLDHRDNVVESTFIFWPRNHLNLGCWKKLGELWRTLED